MSELGYANRQLETVYEELQAMNDELRVGTDELRWETESASSRADLVSTVLVGPPPGVAVLDDEDRLERATGRAEASSGVPP